MFRTILLKTLHEKRWMMLFWTVGTISMSLLMMAFYHSFSGGNFDEAFKNLPKSFQNLVGDVASLKTVPGYVAQQVFALRIPLLTLIMSIVLFSGILAGDEGEGTLQTLLTQPVSRLKVFTEKYLAALLVSFIICLGAFVGVWVGLRLIHENMSDLRLLQAVVGVWLLSILFGTVGYAIGAITGKRSLAGSLAGLLAFSTYLLTSFVNNVSGLRSIEKLSPFHYYNTPAIAEHGLKSTNLIVMVGVIVVLCVLSASVFIKRDIYQR